MSSLRFGWMFYSGWCITEQVIKEMYNHNKQPIVFPLSNPTRLHEAFPIDIMKWTDNKALIATGSPFEPVNGFCYF